MLILLSPSGFYHELCRTTFPGIRNARMTATIPPIMARFARISTRTTAATNGFAIKIIQKMIDRMPGIQVPHPPPERLRRVHSPKYESDDALENHRPAGQRHHGCGVRRAHTCMFVYHINTVGGVRNEYKNLLRSGDRYASVRSHIGVQGRPTPPGPASNQPPVGSIPTHGQKYWGMAYPGFGSPDVISSDKFCVSAAGAGSHRRSTHRCPRWSPSSGW
jgi:hypothetical protein